MIIMIISIIIITIRIAGRSCQMDVGKIALLFKRRPDEFYESRHGLCRISWMMPLQVKPRLGGDLEFLGNFAKFLGHFVKFLGFPLARPAAKKIELQVLKYPRLYMFVVGA